MIIFTYAAILALFYIYQSALIIKTRRAEKVALGDGNNPLLFARIRAHANFAEYMPLALLLLTFVEMSGLASWLVHLLGLMLVIGRILHYLAITAPLGPLSRLPLRVGGMVLTLAPILLSALILLGKSFFPLTL